MTGVRLWHLVLFGLLCWVSGAFYIVSDELQAIPWNGFYNFPLIGEFPKFGGYLGLGAWDIVWTGLAISSGSAALVFAIIWGHVRIQNHKSFPLSNVQSGPHGEGEADSPRGQEENVPRNLR